MPAINLLYELKETPICFDASNAVIPRLILVIWTFFASLLASVNFIFIPLCYHIIPFFIMTINDIFRYMSSIIFKKVKILSFFILIYLDKLKIYIILRLKGGNLYEFWRSNFMAHE